MRRFPVVVAAALLFVASHATATTFEQECEARLPPTSVEVQSYPSDIVYDFTQGVQQLTAASPHRHPGEYVLGTTSRRFQLALRWNGSMLRAPDGRACSRPVLSIDVWVGPQTVSIAREFPQGTCAFNEIAQHELRHVVANQDHVERVADELRRELSASLGNRVFYGTPEELRNAFTSHLQGEWMQWGMARFEDVQSVHAVIDSPQEYARTKTLCGGAISRVLQAFRGR